MQKPAVLGMLNSMPLFLKLYRAVSGGVKFSSRFGPSECVDTTGLGGKRGPRFAREKQLLS